MPPHPRHIIHADLDAFYADVEQLDNPELRGLPALVGGRPNGKGVAVPGLYPTSPSFRVATHLDNCRTFVP